MSAPASPPHPHGRQIQLPLDREELLELMQESLESLALELGLLVASGLLEDEVTRLCGPRYQRQPDRTHTRYGHQRGVATLAGQKVAIERPRVRHTDDRGEVPLETYARLQSPDAMPRAVLRRMIRGVSTRDYAEVVELAREGFGVAKSSVSRDFVRASAADVKALAERRFERARFPVVMIDGVEYAGATMVVALGITEDGTKRILGLRQGATENAAVCVALLEDLQARGLDTGQPTLLVLDGSKALHAAATRVWGWSSAGCRSGTRSALPPASTRTGSRSRCSPNSASGTWRWARCLRNPQTATRARDSSGCRRTTRSSSATGSRTMVPRPLRRASTEGGCPSRSA